MYNITASIVLYRNNLVIVEKAIHSFLNTTLKVKLYLIDNSPTDAFRELEADRRIEYIFNKGNIGFGAGHNIAINKAVTESEYHLILNPDVRFDKGTLEEILRFMDSHLQVGQLLPKVLYNDGKLQKVCKLLPHPYDLLARRFFKNQKWAIKRNEKYELNGFNYDRPLNIPSLSGCFMFIRTSVLKDVGGFDPRYFMYLEDIDLTRRIHESAETICFPGVSIYHGYEKGSYVSPKLLRYHILSAIKYFNKWGWFFDKQRSHFNKQVLTALGQGQ